MAGEVEAVVGGSVGIVEPTVGRNGVDGSSQRVLVRHRVERQPDRMGGAGGDGEVKSSAQESASRS